VLSSNHGNLTVFCQRRQSCEWAIWWNVTLIDFDRKQSNYHGYWTTLALFILTTINQSMLHSIRSLTHRTASFDRKQSNYSGYWLVKTEGFLCNPCNKSGFSFSWMLPIRECVKMSYFYQDLKDLLILIKMIVTSNNVTDVKTTYKLWLPWIIS
jgi:hypothetical protein